MYCPKCGSETPEGSSFCNKCGANMQTGELNTYVDQRKSKLVAGLLQIFIPGFGIGRFYLGYNNIAIAQILVTFFSCGIGAIWPFIDGILIIAGQVTVDVNGNPLKE